LVFTRIGPGFSLDLDAGFSRIWMIGFSGPGYFSNWILAVVLCEDKDVKRIAAGKPHFD